MKISCICLTYGRPDVLAEAVESFLRQDYEGEKELLIVNDLASQQLVCDLQDVRVINLPERIPNLAAKYNFAIGQAEGDVLTIWDDDDIYLPHRLSTTANCIRGQDWYHTTTAWFDETPGGKLRLCNNVHHPNLAFSRDAWERAGGYTVADNDPCGLDQEFMRKLGVVSGSVSALICFLVYRWQGTGSWHVSALGDNVSEKAGRWAMRRGTQAGEVVVEPRWSRQWDEVARESMEAL
jgi:hypothetical protein